MHIKRLSMHLQIMYASLTSSSNNHILQLVILFLQKSSTELFFDSIISAHTINGKIRWAKLSWFSWFCRGLRKFFREYFTRAIIDYIPDQ